VTHFVIVTEASEGTRHVLVRDGVVQEMIHASPSAAAAIAARTGAQAIATRAMCERGWLHDGRAFAASPEHEARAARAELAEIAEAQALAGARLLRPDLATKADSR